MKITSILIYLLGKDFKFTVLVINFKIEADFKKNSSQNNFFKQELKTELNV